MTTMSWSSDVPISRPVVEEERVVVIDFGGFGFTTGGITNNISDVEAEAIFLPTFAPEGYAGE